MVKKMVSAPLKIFAPKDSVVLRFDEHDAAIARNWRDAGSHAKKIKTPGAARF